MPSARTVLVATTFLAVAPTVTAQSSGLRAYGRLPLAFEGNRGQWDGTAKFLSRGPGYRLFLTGTGSVMGLRHGRQEHVLETVLVGADPQARARGLEPLGGKVSYLRGDPSNWRTGVCRYRKVHFSQVHPGVDLVYYGNQGQLEYDFVVAPGTDPGVIRLRFDGAAGLEVDAEGDLVLTVPQGRLHHKAPFAYQEVAGKRIRVDAGYRIGKDGIVSFDLGAYDTGRQLVIDPVLAYASYLGGSGADQDCRLTVDQDGHAIVSGWVFSTDFPTKNAVSSQKSGSTDVFVTKLNKDGSDVLWSSYLGGAGDEIPGDICVARDGSVGICGYSQSVAGFPFKNPVLTTKPGGAQAFVIILDKNGGLVLGTYFGGEKTGTTQAFAIGLDDTDVVIAGRTDSTDLPATTGAFQSARNGRFGDAFVARLARTGGKNAVRVATYLGGTSTETVLDLAMGPGGGVSLFGEVFSTDFPIKNGFQTTHGGAFDAFVVVLDGGLRNLGYGTFIGGSRSECQGRSHTRGGIAVGPKGHIHVVGDTQSPDFPTTPGAHDRTFQVQEGFLVKIDSSQIGARSLVFSTLFGGNSGEMLQAVDVDANGNIFVSGYSNSTKDFPLAHPIFQPQATTATGYTEAVVAALDPTGGKLLFSTAFGGTGHEDASGMMLGADGAVYFCGTTGSRGSGALPVSSNAFQKTASAGVNTYVAKLEVRFATQENYGTGLKGTNGVPTLVATAPPVLGSRILLNIGNSRGAPTSALIMIGLQQANLNLLGGTLLVQPAIEAVVPLATGGMQLPIDVPADNSFSGATAFVQVLQLDPAAPFGVSFSRGLRLFVGI